MRMKQITRRHVFKAAGFFGIAGVLGVGWALTGEREKYLEGVLKFHLGNTPVEDNALSSCAEQYVLNADGAELGKINKLVKISRLIGVSGVSKLLDNWAPYDNFRRRLVTYFLLNSTYFHRENKDEAVIFDSAAPVCGNPFARFD